MKLTNTTTPQARNYQCDKCKAVMNHKSMVDDSICCYCEKEIDKELGGGE